MRKKKIAIIGPVTPHGSDIPSIALPLAFLTEEYSIDCIDPLESMENLSTEHYYAHWQQRLKPYSQSHDAFIGFSFGGVILQQCFDLFAHLRKPIVLISTPTFADDALKKKLGEVISLCRKNQLPEALQSLYQHVFYPNAIPSSCFNVTEPELAMQRLIFGLDRVLNTNSSRIARESTVNHLHLLGENSRLVNQTNVVPALAGDLQIVPGASMRVLEDNPAYCRTAILGVLNNDNQ